MNQTIKDFLKKHFTSLAFFYRYLRYRIVVMVVVGILIGLLDGLGLTMFIPLLQSVAGETGMDSHQSLGKLAFVVDGIHSMGFSMTLEVILMTMLLFFTIKGAFKFIQGYISAVYEQYFIREVRFETINLFTQFRYDNFVKADAGRIQNTLSTEVERIKVAFRKYNQIIQQLMLIIAYVTMAFLANLQFALLVAVGGGLTNVLFNTLYRKTKGLSHRLVASNHAFQGLLIQMVAFFKYLKATGSIKGYAQYLKTRVEEIEISHRKMGILNGIMMGLREPLIIGVVVLVILLQVRVLGGELAAVLLSLLLLYRGLTSITQMQGAYNQFLSFSGSLHHVDAFMQELRTGQDQKQKKIFPGFEQELTLQNVSFHYLPDQTPVVQDINLTIRKNETLAIVGESGSGKTTLMNIVSGLLHPQGGKVLIDGSDLYSYDLASYQQRIGYITQESVIFDDTLFNNVTFWAAPTEENRKRCWKALTDANVAQFVLGLPEQLNTRLGNNGINLSGGQKQRISIARELYKEVDFLFLDEATSALDSETENVIQQNIDELKGKYTILIIAHRLSTIKNADRVVVMKQSRLDEHGTYEELFIKSETFKKMIELQEL